MDEPRVVAALPRLIKSSDTVISQAPLGSASRPLAHRTRTTSTSAITARKTRRVEAGWKSSLSSPASMKWIGTTISVVISIIRPARPAPQRSSPVPSAASSKVPASARVHLPSGDQSRSPSRRCAPTVELTTIKRTARERISFCQCSLTNSDAKPDQERSSGTKTASAGERSPPARPPRSRRAFAHRGKPLFSQRLHPSCPHRVTGLKLHQTAVHFAAPRQFHRLASVRMPCWPVLRGRPAARQESRRTSRRRRRTAVPRGRCGPAADARTPPGQAWRVPRPFQPSLFPRRKLRSHACELRLQLGKKFGSLRAPRDRRLVVFLAPAKLDDHPPGIDALADRSESPARPSSIACFGRFLARPLALTMQDSYLPARSMASRRLRHSPTAVS